MDGLFILVVLVLVGGIIVLPAAAFIRSGRAIREAEYLRHKLTVLENELQTPKHRLRPQPTTPPTPTPQEGAFSTPVTVQPPVRAPLPPEHATARETVGASGIQAPGTSGLAKPAPPRLPPLVQARPEAAAPAPVAASVGARMPKIDWEQFMGVKLFAWLGGFALFLAVGYFVKYSFERDLIPPEVRVALGFLTGLGLVLGGVVLKQRQYAVTSQTLCGTGVVDRHGDRCPARL